ncbi:HAD family hydrolase [Flexivirga caeni]|uniref:HAD family hydrolase n=1 Tax=Flexivirga caeni TaxID=2294115 RepID=A0A3M9MJT4_9MICO|nr:HAD hydrolase-like protein [Flexivirga caeni]RNI25123.1 HAD family hydrolase [Flexivirga caeni]
MKDAGLVVGFDLDMTLVDSRHSIAGSMRKVLQERGVAATDEQLWPLIGAPLLDNLGHFLPAGQVVAAAADYRAHYLQHAIELTVPLPGAAALVAAIHETGGTVLVVSAKNPPAVRATLEHVGIVPDVVVGDLFGHDKSAPLREHGATAYVGDHAGDMHAARAAEAVAVGVTTGPADAVTLRAAGADLIVGELTELVPRLGELRTR